MIFIPQQISQLLNNQISLVWDACCLCAVPLLHRVEQSQMDITTFLFGKRHARSKRKGLLHRLHDGEVSVTLVSFEEHTLYEVAEILVLHVSVAPLVPQPVHSDCIVLLVQIVSLAE